MKKVIIMIAASLTLAGCSFSSGGSGEGSGDQVTVEIYQGKVEFKEQFEELAAEYEEENPDVNIEITSVGGGNDYAGSLKTRFASGDEPEIFSIAGPTEAENFEEYLADVSDTASADAALEGSLEPVTKDEEVLGLPFNQEGYGLIYNKRVFEEAGVNAEEIQSYEDLESAVEELDSQKEDLGLESVFAFPAKEQWVPGNHLSNVFIAPEFDQQVLNAYEADSVEFEKGSEFQRMIDLQNDYSIQPTLTLDYSQQVEQHFSLEEVAIIQQGNWIYPSVEQMDPEFAEENMGIIPIPVEGFDGKMPVGIPNYWGVNKNSGEEEVQASKDFIDYLYTSEAGKEAVLQDFKFIPAYEGFDTENIADPLSKEIYQYASEGNTIGWVFLGYPGTWGDDIGGYIQEYLSGDMTWDEVEEESISRWENYRQ
ncbi:ABC transporter substrate-binding protein [Halobacillus sp. A1]|uniref:ABC transporter substrate-binding protein n=1 Tax=Halobacillus sp. A1 TaxID=2880262 RepID=UPI0020A66D35|nr:ABC transporter substrate-binding protein [Halobacillus sp. A1]MCP3032520.1 ABC transporter substrate-binding protein [Halobacillus sp. A1]